MNDSGNLWAIVLAGGEGERLKPLVQRWLGRHKPKQYCAFVGTRSMLQHTLDRADKICMPDHKVTVVARSHSSEALPQVGEHRSGRLVLQPANRGTAAGVFLALAHVRRRDPDATVVVLPSDHFIHPEQHFIDVTYRAAVAASVHDDRLFLLGVRPDRLEREYGWIYQGSQLGWISGLQVRTVERFVEKPSPEACGNAMAAGALWNTLVLAVKVETLWQMGVRCFPKMIRLFERYGDAIGTEAEESVLEAVYREMPAHDFSSGLLSVLAEQAVAVELDGVLWSDWGKPDRIVGTLRRIGKSPAFPPALAAAG